MVRRNPNARVKRKSFTLNEYPKGMGKIKCELCGFPLRDHKMDTHPMASQ